MSSEPQKISFQVRLDASGTDAIRAVSRIIKWLLVGGGGIGLLVLVVRLLS